MGRAKISYGLITSQNQGGGNKKQGLPPTIGLGHFSINIITRKAGYCICTTNQTRYTVVITSTGQSGYPAAGTIIFDGYLIIDNVTSTIIGVYETGDATNRLLPKNDNAYPDADNIYPINGRGVNFYSTTLQNALQLPYNNFNLYNDSSRFVLYHQNDINTSIYSITIV